jgi:hypothetical protein
MVAAIVLHKKRLVDILDEACELNPLNGIDVDPPPSPLAKSRRISAASTVRNKRRRNGPQEDWAVRDSRPRVVSFSEGPPKVVFFNNYDSCTTEADREAVRRTLWYTVR